MSAVTDEDIKRLTARRKFALVLEIIQVKTMVAEASGQFDLTPAEVQEWVEQGKAGMENALRAKPEDVRVQNERHLKDLREAYGDAMLEFRARKLWRPCWARTRPDSHDPAGTAGRRRASLDVAAVPVVLGAASIGLLPVSQGA